jgi:SAM-dependent methyltransferase
MYRVSFDPHEMKIISNLNKIFLRNLFVCDKPCIELTKAQLHSLSDFQNKVNQGVYTFEQAPCLCGNSGGILLTERDRYCLSVNTYLCKFCGILRTNPRLDRSSLLKFYDQDYRSIYIGYSQPPNEFFKQQEIHGKSILSFIQSSIKPKENLIVFDVGCGAGGTLIPFKDIGCKVFGCDLGSQYLHLGRNLGLTLEHGDIESLGQYGKADLIILSQVLEHLPRPFLELRKISDLLNTNGYLYIELPGVFKIHETVGNPLIYFQNAHLYHFTLSSLNSILQKVGFEVVKGDEYVRALYRKSEKSISPKLSPTWYWILLYFYFAELNYSLGIFQFVQRIRCLPSKLFRVLKGKPR